MEAGDLDGGQDAADDQRGRDKVLLVVYGEVDATLAGQDNGRCHDTGQHCQSVLKAEQESQNDGHAVVQSEEGGRPTILLEERNVGAEEKGIIVATDEALLGEEGLSNTVGTVGESLFRAHIWPNSICFTHC